MKSVLLKASVFLSVYGASAFPVFAATDIGIDAPVDQLKDVKANDVIRWLFTIFIVIAVLASLIWLLIGGIKWVISGGDKEKIESARKQIVAALVGLIIVILAWVILTFVLSLFGIEVSSLHLPTIKEAGQGGQGPFDAPAAP